MSPRLQIALDLVIVAGLGFVCAVPSFALVVLRRVVPPEDKTYPLPHHISKYPGGVSLRLAMVHDVLHERFPRHAKVYFEERNRQAEKAIREEEAEQKTGAAPSARYFGLIDDLAVGQERLGQFQPSIDRMRRKLEKQKQCDLFGRDLYTSYANLGTFLIHQQMAMGVGDKKTAEKRLREGAALIREAIAVYPEAHFGRERWQAITHEFFLARLREPGLLLMYDLVGNQLDAAEPPRIGRCYKRGYSFDGIGMRVQAFVSDLDGGKKEEGDDRDFLRGFVTRVGSEGGWPEVVPNAHQQPVPFDEPTLGIIGMWRYGSGANPHFALALGEIMLRVGQRYIAWCAYERASLLAGKASADPHLVEGFTSHCQRRQALIEKELPRKEVRRLRPRFEAELAFGQDFQNQYQAYEEQRIREGASLEDPHFYDAFEAGREPIASPVGREYAAFERDPTAFEALSLFLLCIGANAFLIACLLRLRKRRAKPSIPGTARVTEGWGPNE